MNIRIASIALLILGSASAKAQVHQSLQADFNRMIEDTNRDGATLHDQISRDIQNADTEQQWDKNDDPNLDQKKQFVQTEDSDVR